MGGSDDWGDWSGPSAEELLRQEYPDLMDLWKKYQDKISKFNDIEEHLNRFSFIERMFKTSTYIYVFEKWIKVHEEHQEAKKEYDFLEKLLKDY